VNYVAAPCQQRLTRDFVFRVDRQRWLSGPVLAEQVSQKGRDVLRVHLARVIGNERRRIRGSKDGDTAVHDDLVRSGQLAIAAALGRQINDH
jgi:hypothetical protein